MLKSLITAEDFLNRPDPGGLLDVRAEIEFASGSIPGSVNIPLLADSERHTVGLCYKEKGQEAAILLGHELVSGPVKEARVQAWLLHLKGRTSPTLTCFRGGLRSQISQEWIQAQGLPVERIQGGYKALRRVLQRECSGPLRGFVLSGLTGSGKSVFLRKLRARSSRCVDLEALAVHRGSAFGGLFQPRTQPAQQSFENALGLELRRQRGREFLFEDESRLVGRCILPDAFFASLSLLPRVQLECAFPERVSIIVEEYVRTPLLTRSKAEVEHGLLTSLHTLRNRLGGLAEQEIAAGIRLAFSANTQAEAEGLHSIWVGRLLNDYYDPLYHYSLSRQPREPVFRGDKNECIRWLEQNSDLFSR